jgi:hypothetical protein
MATSHSGVRIIPLTSYMEHACLNIHMQATAYLPQIVMRVNRNVKQYLHSLHMKGLRPACACDV